MKKLSKRDFHNLGCLKLAEMGIWKDDEALNNMQWESPRPRAQRRYLKKMINILTDINRIEPGLIEHLFDYNGTEKLREIAEQRNIPIIEEKNNG